MGSIWSLQLCPVAAGLFSSLQRGRPCHPMASAAVAWWQPDWQSSPWIPRGLGWLHLALAVVFPPLRLFLSLFSGLTQEMSFPITVENLSVFPNIYQCIWTLFCGYRKINSKCPSFYFRHCFKPGWICTVIVYWVLSRIISFQPHDDPFR